MLFAAPLALLGLAALPVLYFLLKLYPPQTRRIKFPPLALLRGLAPGPRTPLRIPLWLLLLRLFATALIIIGMAGPALHPPKTLPGSGPILLVIDNGWASAADWPARIATANRLLAAAGITHAVAILATAPGAGGAAPRIQGFMTATKAAQVIAALQPEPWPVNRLQALAALQAVPVSTTRLYIADGITDGPGFEAFLKALHPARVFSSFVMPALLSPATLNPDGSLGVHLLSGPASGAILAQDANGNILARAPINRHGEAKIQLPLPLANKITALRLDRSFSAGAVALLDDSSHAVIAGLTATGNNAETPFLGPLYFIRRALPAGSQILTGPLGTLVADKVNLIILADTPLSQAQQDIAHNFIADGGVLIRFAGPLTSSTPDSLYPSPLLGGERRLGGALSWSAPLHLAAFPTGAPLAGLTPDPNATISRQILADPTRLDPATVWASLSDGTPLVLGKRIGNGYLVSILTTANTDWSNLSLSGLFPALINRLTGLGRGAAPDPKHALPLKYMLSAYGVVSSATGTASVIPGALPGTSISPDHPPGIYGAGGTNIALNLGGHVPVPVAAALPNAATLTGNAPAFSLGGPLLAAGILLLVLDLAISLALRGLLKFAFLLLFASLATATAAKADDATLQTELGYIITNDPATDQTSADGLGYLSAYVSAHTSAQLGNPAGLNPTVDDLNLYPLIYWPVRPGTPPLAPAACTALANYMAHGGLLMIDTKGSDAGTPGSGAGFAPGVAVALARATACLNLPPLEPLTTANILAHCFYIVREFPGRFAGAPVMVATAPARDADGVTPIIIGANDWAGAWARDSSGEPEQAPIPGGEDQRLIADRFGTNLVIYALTGSYKADQASAPILLDKLGQ
jgi:hypothetical protein